MARYGLYIILLFLGISLFFPGLYHTLYLYPYGPAITTLDINAANQLRALNAMMACMGLVCFWCCHRVERKCGVLTALALILFGVSAARLCALWIDGWPDPEYLVYSAAEVILACLLLILKPPACRG